MASMAPVAAITYSLLYGISTKRKVITIDTKRSRTDNFGGKHKSSYSIGSLDDYAELLDDDNVLEDPGYQGNVKFVQGKDENFKVQEASAERSNLRGTLMDPSRISNDSELSMRR
jgi:hypothetical protein